MNKQNDENIEDFIIDQLQQLNDKIKDKNTPYQE